jgi:glyoxylase-like metal-dependent hydrolase (beta-lactamase superfamily II)
MRRPARLSILITLIGAWALSIAAARAQQGSQGSQGPTDIRVEKVRDNLYIVTGGLAKGAQPGVAGNTTVFIADSGVVLVDTKYAGFGSTILDQVKSVTNKPVTMIINTHTHGDHTGSNTEFPRAVEFVVHENTRANMARMDQFKGEHAAVLPKRTFGDRLSLLGGRDRIDVYYFGRGHTDGDTVIVFPALGVAVMGDLFARKWAPLVDANNGGSAVAFPQTLARTVSGISNVDTVITGHSTTTLGSGRDVTFVRSNPVMKWADLQEYAEFTRAFVAAATAALKAGQPVDEAVNRLNLPDRFKDYNMTNARADVQRVYDELSAAGSVLFEGARLITGDGSGPIENSAFLVENTRFKSGDGQRLRRDAVSAAGRDSGRQAPRCGALPLRGPRSRPAV